MVTQPKKQPPTIYDVARMAGVSISTVSRVLNMSTPVSEKTRMAVMNAVDGLGFIPKLDARERARKDIGRIGVLTPFFTHGSFVQRMRGIATALSTQPYELVIYTVDSNERLEHYMLVLPMASRLDGLIILSLNLSAQATDRLLKSSLETVLVEQSHPVLPSVEIDDVAGGQLAAEYLTSKGHRRCSFVQTGGLPDYAIRPERNRLEGFRKGLAERGLSLPDEYITELSIHQTGARERVAALLRLPEPPTAIFSATDDLGLLLLRVAREEGLRVPEDLAIIGFDDLDFSNYIGLTTIRQPLDESGRVAVDLLLARLENPERPVQHVRLPLGVIERQTV